jgi:hypothetical protein
MTATGDLWTVDDLPLKPERREAFTRAVRAGATLPLDYVGMGSTGIVFSDARGRAFKVARFPGESTVRKEAEFLRVASTLPEVRRNVARFRRWHAHEEVLEREHVRAESRYRPTKIDRWTVYKAIVEAMKPYGFGPPEFKDDSFVYAKGRGWVLVDAGFALDRGRRLVLHAAEVLRHPFNKWEAEHLAWAVRMERGGSIPPEIADRLERRLLRAAGRESL